MSIFQEELRDDYGYENVAIIAVGQSNISSFNTGFTANSDLPLVMDQYPNLPIREQFSPYGEHKQIVMLDYDGNFIGEIILSFSGLSDSEKNYMIQVIEENYQQSVPGDVNQDTLINVQDIILIVNMILNSNSDSSGDVNQDGVVNILDVVQVVNIILN